MRDTGSFASLSPTLLARKGRARPAMRPQLQTLIGAREPVQPQWQDDLGWNDMGDPPPVGAPIAGAEIVALDPAADFPPAPVEPEVRRQRAAIAERIAAPVAEPAAEPPAQRRSALARGRRAAFTLRLDSERHLALRLAATVGNRSAQQIVTEALDRLIAEMPGIAELAESVRKRR